MRKNIIINKKVLFLIIVLIFILPPKVQADISEPEYSEQYKIWLNLSEKERTKYIEPIKYKIEYINSNTGKRRMLKSSINSSFDLRNVISGMKVKNQKTTSECWAFSIMSSLETNLCLLNNTNYIYDFSERHMDYSTSLTFKDNVKNPIGFNRELGTGGSALMAYAYLTNGMGGIKEKDMPFEDNEDKIYISEIQNKNVCTKVNDWVVFPSINSTDTESEKIEKRNMIKNHIQKYGSVFTSIYTLGNFYNYYNKETCAYYVPNEKLGDHGVSIIGWDDNYSIENFNSQNRPQNPGAYIVRNSWGEQNSAENAVDNGYLYISYEDSVIGNILTGIIDSEDRVLYDELYQYDKLGINSDITMNTSKIYAANVFERESNQKEFLTEISVAMLSPQKCNVYVNATGGEISKSNLNLVYSGGQVLTTGYHTLELDNPVELTGDKFAVIVEYEGISGISTVGVEDINQSTYSTATSASEQSYVSGELGSNWIDLNETGRIACIKAFTNIANGDIDKNNSITINDLALLRKYILGTKILEKEQQVKSDLDGNGKVTLNDMAKLRRKILEKN